MRKLLLVAFAALALISCQKDDDFVNDLSSTTHSFEVIASEENRKSPSTSKSSTVLTPSVLEIIGGQDTEWISGLYTNNMGTYNGLEEVRSETTFADSYKWDNIIAAFDEIKNGNDDVVFVWDRTPDNASVKMVVAGYDENSNSVVAVAYISVRVSGHGLFYVYAANDPQPLTMNEDGSIQSNMTTFSRINSSAWGQDVWYYKYNLNISLKLSNFSVPFTPDESSNINFNSLVSDNNPVSLVKPADEHPTAINTPNNTVNGPVISNVHTTLKYNSSTNMIELKLLGTNLPSGLILPGTITKGGNLLVLGIMSEYTDSDGNIYYMISAENKGPNGIIRGSVEAFGITYTPKSPNE